MLHTSETLYPTTPPPQEQSEQNEMPLDPDGVILNQRRLDELLTNANYQSPQEPLQEIAIHEEAQQLIARIRQHPNTVDVILLAGVCDTVHNADAELLLNELMAELPPALLLDELTQAYDRATAKNTPIRAEFWLLSALKDNEVFLPKTSYDINFPMSVRDKTPPENLSPAWEKMLQEREKED